MSKALAKKVEAEIVEAEQPGQELQVVDPLPSVKDMQLRIQEKTELRRLMADFVNNEMAEGVHYYYFSDVMKRPRQEGELPVLSQDGAYTICELFEYVPGRLETEIIRHDDGHITVVAEAPFYTRSGALVASGNGSCTTRETKYKYRQGERLCPECQQPAIIRAKDFKNEGRPQGWLCYDKKGGCGKKFLPGDQTIEGQKIGRVENTDIADLENTVLKVACKRASVAGVRKMPLVSSLFVAETAEMETNNEPEAPGIAPESRPVASNDQKGANIPAQEKSRLNAIEALISLSGMKGLSPNDEALRVLGKDRFIELQQMTLEEAQEVIADLRSA